MLKNFDRCIANLEKAGFVSSPSLRADVFPPLPAVSDTLFTSRLLFKAALWDSLEQGWNPHQVKACVGQEGAARVEGKGGFTSRTGTECSVWSPGGGGNVTISVLLAGWESSSRSLPAVLVLKSCFWGFFFLVLWIFLCLFLFGFFCCCCFVFKYINENLLLELEIVAPGF